MLLFHLLHDHHDGDAYLNRSGYVYALEYIRLGVTIASTYLNRKRSVYVYA